MENKDFVKINNQIYVVKRNVFRLYETRSIPMFFYYEEVPGYESFFNGTMFIVNKGIHYFLVTAEHVIKRRGIFIEDRNIHIVDIDYEGMPIPVKHVLRPERPDENEMFSDDSYKDINVFPIDMWSINEMHNASIKLRSAEIISNPSLAEEDDLIVVGFPKDLYNNNSINNSTDYENEHHYLTVTTIGGKFQKADYNHLGKIIFEKDYNIGGMSGSPVYLLKNNKIEICGVLILGNNKVPGKTGYFIKLVVINKIIEDYINGNYSAE